MECESPCLGRKIVLKPNISPDDNGADGSPNGVATIFRSLILNSGSVWNPLPPMIASLVICSRLKVEYQGTNFLGLKENSFAADEFE